MSLQHRATAQALFRAVVLATTFGLGLASQDPGIAAPRSGDGVNTEFEPDILKAVADLFADLADTIRIASWQGIAIGPEIVTGEASCPYPAGGAGFDCAAAAEAVCARAGFQSGVPISTSTRRVCRGSVEITGAASEKGGCKSRTSTTRALCW